MANYDYAIGHDQTTLTALPVRPKSDGVIPLTREFAVGGDVADSDGHYCELVWTALLECDLIDILEALTLNANKTADITISLPDEITREFASYNATAVQPQPGDGFTRSDDGKITNVRIVLRDVEEVGA